MPNDAGGLFPQSPQKVLQLLQELGLSQNPEPDVRICRLHAPCVVPPLAAIGLRMGRQRRNQFSNDAVRYIEAPV
ncbi:hypothetical protein GCM10017708_24250 [Arthrobacter citreus]